MLKYFQVIKNTFEEYFVYRLNFLLWRFRNFVLLFSLLFFWSALYGDKQSLLGYQKNQMLTYTLGIAVLRSIVLASRTADLAGQIKTGQIAPWFLRPIGIFKFWASRDLADKILNIFFTAAELGLIVLIFKPALFFQTNLFYIFAFLILCFLATVLYFILNLVAGATGFWLADVWAPRFLFIVIFLEFGGGGFFPLDVLPPIFEKILRLTPFPYLIYYPLKIWLGQIEPMAVIVAILVTGIWAALFYYLLKIVWRKGLITYDVPGI